MPRTAALQRAEAGGREHSATSFLQKMRGDRAPRPEPDCQATPALAQTRPGITNMRPDESGLPARLRHRRSNAVRFVLRSGASSRGARKRLKLLPQFLHGPKHAVLGR